MNEFANNLGTFDEAKITSIDCAERIAQKDKILVNKSKVFFIVFSFIRFGNLKNLQKGFISEFSDTLLSFS